MTPTFTKNGASFVDVIVIGAGHSGLAMSSYLSARSIDHLVLERGQVANTWRHERWDSLRLLTPNWQARLPGYRYQGSDADGYMTMPDVVSFISDYARHIDAPVLTGAEVLSVVASNDLYRVTTTAGVWTTRAVVMASGALSTPSIPDLSKTLPSGVFQLSSKDYRNPDSLPDGGVLVVGGSATGLQLAAELQASGRPVTLAVGEHVRMPRTYRGRDIQYWLDRAGILDETFEAVDDIRRARRVPSPQLVGAAAPEIFDLNHLSARGVRLTGKLVGSNGSKLQFSGSLQNVCTLANLKMNRMLNTIDEWIERHGPAPVATPPERYPDTRVSEPVCLSADLDREGIKSVLWATGFRPHYPWLYVPVFDRNGQVQHHGGVVNAPGLYIMGLPFLRRRKSSFIHGAEDDARDLSRHLAAYLGATSDSVLRRKAG